jgi:TorA maturation chaperone TorD
MTNTVTTASPSAEKDLSRETLCRLLSASYYQPEEAFREERVYASLAEAAGRLSQELGALARGMETEFERTPLQDLLLDYSRLFLGPFDIVAKPYGSVWLEGEKVVMGDSTMAALDLYREGGFELDENFREVPDHIAAELEFLYLLIFRENEARRGEDADGLATTLDIKRRFLKNHLGRWIMLFAKAMKDGAQTAFYTHLAELTEDFVKEELRRAEA